ncbi:MAG: transposase, partial [Actinomycetota bacterium]|nr:transposase [Actinomycetota bacterium]
ISKFLCKGHLWSPSYFAGSCGGAPLSVISDYIARQKIPQ